MGWASNVPGPGLCHSSWWGWGSACDHHLPGGVVGKGLRPVKHLRIWGTKHMLQWGPRALDLDDRQTPTSPELGPLDSGP